MVIKKIQRMKSKKAQMKIQEMSFMLIAVFIFFAMVGMMVVTVRMSELKNSANVLKEKNAMLLVSKLANSPEFSCGDVYGNIKTDCIDEDKVMALKLNIDKYTTFWGATNIEIRKIYPVTLPYKEIECNSTSYPVDSNGKPCNYIKLINKSISGVDRSNFVALCRKEKSLEGPVNKCEMGRLIIRYNETK